MLLGILLTIHIIVCVLLTGVVLIQKSEGGALGMGGGPTGFMSARGTGDLLTRATWILFAIFLLLSVGLTFIAGRQSGNASVTDRVKIKSLDIDKMKSAPLPQGPSNGAPPPITAPTPSLGLAPALTPAPSTAPAAPAPAVPEKK